MREVSVETIEVNDGKRIIVCSIKRKKRMKTIRMRMIRPSTVAVSCAVSTPHFLIKRIVLDNIFGLEKRYSESPRDLLPLLSLSDKHKYSDQVFNLVCERGRSLSLALFKLANNISIGSSRTRWGSCDARRNLRFHYKLALLPTHLADYVIAHELTHLVELNHGPNFWRVLENILPNARLHRKELKKYNLD